MQLEEFATKYRLRTRRDSCGEPIIPGKPRKALRPEDRSHIYDNGDGRFGLTLIMGTAKKWNSRRKQAQAAGFEVAQNGDAEGSLLFDPGNSAQAKLAIKLAGVRERRPASPAQVAALARARLRSAKPLYKASVGA